MTGRKVCTIRGCPHARDDGWIHIVPPRRPAAPRPDRQAA